MKNNLMFHGRLLRAIATVAAVTLPTAHAIAAPVSTALPSSDTIRARSGVIRITPKFHATLQIEYAGKVIVIDPVSAGSYTRKADVILITHAHPDHFDVKAISKLLKSSTAVILPPALTGKVDRNTVNFIMLRNKLHPSYGSLGGSSIYDSSRFVPNSRIEAVPAYNLVRGPEPGQKFHPKGEGNGYIITLGGKRIYIAGDTEATPEMRRLKNIDIAFLPMNLPFTMTPQEAASAARAFRPKIVYPYHYRYPFNKLNTNVQQFAAALKGSGIQVRSLNWYPAAAVARATTR